MTEYEFIEEIERRMKLFVELFMSREEIDRLSNYSHLCYDIVFHTTSRGYKDYNRPPCGFLVNKVSASLACVMAREQLTQEVTQKLTQ